MTESRPASPRQGFVLLLSAAVAVAIWKAAALLLWVTQGDGSQGSLQVKALLSGVGVAYLVCGLVVLWKSPRKESLLFAGFAVCAGLHWGGPLELASGTLRAALLFLYLLVSSLLGEALFLHFALSFPARTRAAGKPALTRLLYAPLVLGAGLAATYLLAPPESALRSTTEGAFLLLHLVTSNLFPVLALVLFATFMFRSRPSRGEKGYVGLMIAGMLTAWLPYLFASAAGWETDPWNLFMVALPLTFLVGILGLERTRAAGESSDGG